MGIRKKFIITISSILVVLILVAIFVIWPTIKDIKKISQAIYEERLDLERKYIKGQLLKKTMRDFEEVKKNSPLIDSVFIVEGEELKFITALEEIADRYLLFQKINLQSEGIVIKGDKSSLPLQITLEGNFITIIKYLVDLEKLNYYFNIDNIRISSTGQKNLGSVNVSLVGNVYSKKAE